MYDITFPSDKDLENSSFASTRLAKIVIPKELIQERLATKANSNQSSSGLITVPIIMWQKPSLSISLSIQPQ